MGVRREGNEGDASKIKYMGTKYVNCIKDKGMINEGRNKCY